MLTLDDWVNLALGPVYDRARVPQPEPEPEPGPAVHWWLDESQVRFIRSRAYQYRPGRWWYAHTHRGEHTR